MIKQVVYKLNGEKAGDITLDEAIFAKTANDKLVTQIVQAQMANRRNSIAHTKTRGEVSGGGRKPYKQKGTGNARAGSSRSPLWIGGGITFGPRNARNFTKRVSIKMKRSALNIVLSEKALNKKIIIVDDLSLKTVKTKQITGILANLPIEEGKIMVVLSEVNPNWELSAANIPYIKTVKVENLNVLDILMTDYMIFTQAALEKTMQIFGSKEKK